ncbi:hypothetical protein HPB52_013803 [Rhipicephalus sanguineus]|uniref:Uncharacterized protein n=1 Tax=Rhipicephalus sanguineus TaxID=34632 RepID=A0A9D4YPV4_RHISA|nr:hypothetical protein HPB52_013803 [Rhipicephalus sanguineus]
MFEIDCRNRAAATSAPGASPTPSEPGQLQDMSTVAVPKRSRRRKRKSKLADDFGSTSSGPSHLQSDGDVIFQRLLAFFTMHQNVNQDDERQYAVGGDHSKKEPIVHRKQELTPLTEFDVVDIVRRLRDVLRKNGPSQEDDLLEALSTSQAQIIINVYGTITAFLDRRPGFEVIYENLYTFVYYKYTDDEDDVLDEGTDVSRTHCSNESGCQYSVAGGDGIYRGWRR